MRSSSEMYKEVAERCSAYDKASSKDCMCNAVETGRSCLTCTHFAKDEHCKLDLYDPIAEEIK